MAEGEREGGRVGSFEPFTYFDQKEKRYLDLSMFAVVVLFSALTLSVAKVFPRLSENVGWRLRQHHHHHHH